MVYFLIEKLFIIGRGGADEIEYEYEDSVPFLGGAVPQPQIALSIAAAPARAPPGPPAPEGISNKH